MPISGLSVTYTAVGGIILWSGLKGETLAQTVKDVASGKAPSTNQQPIAAINDASAPTPSGQQSFAQQVTTGNSSSNGMTALKKAAAAHGWTSSAEWQALNYVEMREAGYRLTATNPTSGAYGMAQFINGPSEYYTYGGDPNTYDGQAVAMCNYIAQTYGDPINAAAHEQTYNWY